MPTYEYVCEACGHAWEAFQSIKADPLKECPQCGADKARRVVSGGMGFILKGGGWYSDLYASPKKDEGASDESSTSEAGSGEGEKKDGEKKGGESKGGEGKGASGGGKQASSDASSSSD